jgi:hypothetical protein
MKVSEKAFENDQKIKKIRKIVNQKFLKLAKNLYECYENEYYRYLDYETFESYIAQEDISIPPDQAGKLILVYDLFINMYHAHPKFIKNIDYNKLALLVPLLSDKKIKKKDLKDWILQAESNSYTDLKIQVEGALEKT